MKKFFIFTPIAYATLMFSAVLYFKYVTTETSQRDLETLVPSVTSGTESKSSAGGSKGFPGLSKEVSQISKGKSGFFPKGVFAESSWQTADLNRDDFVNDWYGKFLKAMKEPSLLDVTEKNTEVYRFLWLRTFDHPISVRIEHDPSVTKLIFIEMSGQGGYEPGKLIRRTEKPIDDEKWSSFLKLLDQADFWNLEKDKGIGGTDGSEWVVEGFRDGRYHLVDRWSPDEGKYREFCTYLLKLSGIDTYTLGDDLY